MRHLTTIGALATPLLALAPIAVAAASLLGWASVIVATLAVALQQSTGWAALTRLAPGTPATAAAQPAGTIPFAERDVHARSAGIMSLYVTAVTTLSSIMLLALSALVADAEILVPAATVGLAFSATLLIPVRPADTGTLRGAVEPVLSLLGLATLAAAGWWVLRLTGEESSPRWFEEAMGLLVVVGPLVGVANGLWQLRSGRDRREQERGRRVLIIAYVVSAGVTVLALLLVAATDARVQASLGLR